MRLSIDLIKILPLKVVYKLGEKIGLICWKLMPSRRLTVRNNLLIVRRWLEQHDEPKSKSFNSICLNSATKAVFYRTTANLLSSFSFTALPVTRRSPLLEFENIDVLKNATDQGKGVVLLMAHMGPWELISCFPEHFAQHNVDAKFGAIYRPLKNDYIEKWYRLQRKSKGMELFKRKANLLEVFKFINKGGILALLADQRVTNGEISEFFGKPALTTPLVGLLSKKANTSVISLTLKYDRTCKLKAEFRLVDYKEANTRKGYAKITNKELEQILCSDLTSGFWFHERFKT